MKSLTLLGSTGSIGTHTLEVVRANPQHYQVKALVAGCNVELLAQQCQEFRPDYAVMATEIAARQLRQRLSGTKLNIEVLSGGDAACEMAALPDVEQVMAAIVGAAGLLPTLAAIRAGKTVLLANKEALVTCGRLFMQEVQKYGARLMPVDSEHNAIFQSLPHELQHRAGDANLADYGIQSLILTGSGGPFRLTPLDEITTKTPEQACAHPNWVMGKKISVDSATMMNKGLEYIEARWLFNAAPEQMEVLIHPQSVIHSMVRYNDGSVLAQMGTPDMKTPIAHCMAWPERQVSGALPLDFTQISQLSFMPVDFARYPCLELAIQASHSGQAATTILNAVNEINVAAFLERHINFGQIAQFNRDALERITSPEPTTVEAVIDLDYQARKAAAAQLNIPRVFFNL